MARGGGYREARTPVASGMEATAPQVRRQLRLHNISEDVLNMDEPKFTIRAQDALSVHTLYVYRMFAIVAGQHEHANEVGKAIAEFHQWQRENPTKVKLPFHEHISGSE